MTVPDVEPHQDLRSAVGELCRLVEPGVRVIKVERPLVGDFARGDHAMSCRMNTRVRHRRMVN